jgi:hypothetical protein
MMEKRVNEIRRKRDNEKRENEKMGRFGEKLMSEWGDERMGKF